MDFLVLAARVVLAIVFSIAGFAKLADPRGTRALAKDFGSPDVLAGMLVWLLPTAELACAVALIPPATATFGAMATLSMLVVFIVAIGVSLAQGRRPDCHCFGQVHSAPIGGATIARNIVLAGLALFVIAQGNAIGQPGILEGVTSLGRGFSRAGEVSTTWLVLLAVFGLTAAAALAMTYQLLRQNGRLALRIESLEARLGPETSKEPGLDIDTEAPAFVLPSLAGGRVSFEELRRSHPNLLLFFSEPGCGACDEMLAEVARWQRDHHERLHIVPISRGSVETNRDKMNTAGITGVLLQDDREVAQAYQVNATPSAVLVTGGRIASHVVAGDEAIRSLISDATRPAPYAKGDRVSSLQLPDLEGRQVDLGQLAGRRTVLLFWNPSCGFCSDCLDDVKWWERNRDAQVADLIVISKGDDASNLAMGFASRVLLDQDFAVGYRFGAGGTPSAVIVDEHGRVGSTVAVGAPEVLALAGSVSPARRSAAGGHGS